MKRIISKLELVEKTEVKGDRSSKEEKIVLSRIGEEDLYEIQHISDKGEVISYLKEEFDLEKKQKENILLTRKEVTKIVAHFLKYIAEGQNNDSDIKKRYFLQIGVKDIE